MIFHLLHMMMRRFSPLHCIQSYFVNSITISHFQILFSGWWTLHLGNFQEQEDWWNTPKGVSSTIYPEITVDHEIKNIGNQTLLDYKQSHIFSLLLSSMTCLLLFTQETIMNVLIFFVFVKILFSFSLMFWSRFALCIKDPQQGIFSPSHIDVNESWISF